MINRNNIMRLIRAFTICICSLLPSPSICRPSTENPLVTYPEPADALQVHLSLAADYDAIPVNHLVALQASFHNLKTRAPESIDQLRFEARMPEHRHGMLTQPKISQIQPHRFRIEGVKLHMPGFWELVLTVRWRGQRRVLVVPINIGSQQALAR